MEVYSYLCKPNDLLDEVYLTEVNQLLEWFKNMHFYLPEQEDLSLRKPVLQAHTPFEHSKLVPESQTVASWLQSAPGLAEI